MLQAHSSEPLVVYVSVMRAGRSPQVVRDALRNNNQLQHVYSELVDGQGAPGAKLICRPEHKESIIRYLNEHGADLQGAALRLPQMKPRHIIVADDFQAMVDQAIDSIPTSHHIRPRRGQQIPILLFDLTQAAPACVLL